MGRARNTSVTSRKISTPRRSQKAWDAKKWRIEQLYMNERKHLSDVMKTLENEGFIATIKQYKTQLHQWGFWKSDRAKQNWIARTTQWEQAPTTPLNSPDPDSLVSTSSDIDFNTVPVYDTSFLSVFGLSMPPLVAEAVSSLSDEENTVIVTFSQRQPRPWKDRQCLRCSLLMLETKYSSDDADKCDACWKLAYAYAYQKEMLGFFACIRTVIRDVNIFKAYLPLDGQHGRIHAAANELALSRITLDFASQINNWPLDNYVNDVVHWFNSSSSSTTSKVGILSSNEFLECAASVVDGRICTNFRWMIYAISLAYTQGAAPSNYLLNTSELVQVGSLAGYNLLEVLDEKLEASSLTRYNRNELQALFLLLTGTILAVSYCPELDTIQNERNHLCYILAHYMAYVAWALKLPISPEAEHDTNAQQYILGSALFRWHREGFFEWSTIGVVDPPSIVSSQTLNISETEIFSSPSNEKQQKIPTAPFDQTRKEHSRKKRSMIATCWRLEPHRWVCHQSRGHLDDRLHLADHIRYHHFPQGPSIAWDETLDDGTLTLKTSGLEHLINGASGDYTWTGGTLHKDFPDSGLLDDGTMTMECLPNPYSHERYCIRCGKLAVRNNFCEDCLGELHYGMQEKRKNLLV